MNCHPSGGGRLLGPEQVLDGDWHSVKRPAKGAIGDLALGSMRGFECGLRGDVDIAAQPPI